MKRKNAKPQLKYRDFSFKVESANDDGEFTGYASVFGEVDSYNEVVAPGAFTKSLEALRSSGTVLPALWQHMSWEPVGGYNELAEDDRGLKVAGFLLVNEIVRAKEANALMKRKIVTGMSIGYYVIDSGFDEKTRIRTLKELELVEISIVTFPANDSARIDQVKSKLAHGSLPTIREFEGILREAGFSKTQAAVIANRGLKHLLERGEPESIPQTSELANLLTSFKV